MAGDPKKDGSLELTMKWLETTALPINTIVVGVPIEVVGVAIEWQHQQQPCHRGHSTGRSQAQQGFGVYKC